MVDRRITKSAQYDNNTLFSLGLGCLITEAWSALNRVCDTHFHLDLRFLCSCRDGLCCLCGLYRVLPTRCHAIHNYQSLSLTVSQISEATAVLSDAFQLFCLLSNCGASCRQSDRQSVSLFCDPFRFNVASFFAFIFLHYLPLQDSLNAICVFCCCCCLAERVEVSWTCPCLFPFTLLMCRWNCEILITLEVMIIMMLVVDDIWTLFTFFTLILIPPFPVISIFPY